jgi:hypothetical protein
MFCVVVVPLNGARQMPSHGGVVHALIIPKYEGRAAVTTCRQASTSTGWDWVDQVDVLSRLSTATSM